MRSKHEIHELFEYLMHITPDPRTTSDTETIARAASATALGWALGKIDLPADILAGLRKFRQFKNRKEAGS